MDVLKINGDDNDDDELDFNSEVNLKILFQHCNNLFIDNSHNDIN